jgi:iron complex transport system permease protein
MKLLHLHLILGTILLLLTGASLCVGTVNLSPGQVLHALLASESDPLRTILWELRVPRALLGLLVGAALGLTGAAMQGYTRNPLADSGLLGISGGAALGAVITFYSGWSTSFPLALPLGALCGAALAMALVALLARQGTGLYTLILAGVAVSSITAALTSLALNLSPNPYANMEILFWLMGSLTDRSWDHVHFCWPFHLLGMICLLLLTRPLQALSLGEETAQSLGISPMQTRWLLIAGGSLLVGPATAVAGGIGFVGLLVPHLLRPWVQHDPGHLLGVSAWGGAILLLSADIALRLFPMDQELRLGVVTALLGAPFFLLLVLRLDLPFGRQHP